MSKRRRAAEDDLCAAKHAAKSENDQKISTNLIPRILSGSVGSIITALAVTPLEVVKIRQQSSGVKPISYSNFSGVQPCRGCGTLVLNNGLMECSIPVETATSTRSIASTAPPHTSGTFRTLFSIFKQEGYSGIYAGLRPTLLMSVPNTVLYFTAYDEISTRLRNNHNLNKHNIEQSTQHMNEIGDDKKRQAYIPLVAGSLSRLLASLSTAPLELVRTRQASAIGNGEKVVPGMMEEFRFLLRSNGFSSLFTGLAPTLWRDVPFSAIYWLFLEQFRNDLSTSSSLGTWGGRYYKDQGVQIPPSIEVTHSFISGAGAGAIAAFGTTPFDVVKTRRQMSSQTEVLSTGSDPCDHFGLKEYSGSRNNCQQRSISVAAATERGRFNNVGTFGHMREILKDEGLSGLWRGNTTRVVKVAPACAIMISCYEFGKKVFGEIV